MQDKRRFFSGATLEQAVARAARHYGVDPAELAYREREKKHGFLHRRRGIVVEVNPSELSTRAGSVETAAVEAVPSPGPTVTPPDPGGGDVEESWSEPLQAPAGEIEGAGSDGDELFSAEWWQGEEAAGATTLATPDEAMAPPDEGVRIDTARDGLRRLLSLTGVSLESEIREGEDRLEIELSGNDQRVVLERGGEVLLALEHLLPRVIRGLSGVGCPCRVDADGFHAAREVKLRELAENRASEVSQSRRRRTLPPMSPEERRIVHLTLADRSDVQTESRGEGFFKRVTIFPGG